MAEPDTLASHELRHQAEFARKVFVRLAGYDYSLGLVNAPSNILTDRLRSKKDLLAQLCSTLLPLLRQQIAGLSEALWAPNTLQEKPDLVVMLVLEIQPKLELTLDRIICDINDIIPGPVPEPKQTEDQHFKQFKSYRIFGLVNSIRKEMQSELAAFFADCGDIIHQIPTPLEERYIHSRSSLPDDTLRSIDAAIRWSEGSELYVIFDLWESKMQVMDDLLDDISGVINSEYRPRTQPLIQIAQSFIPLIKLSKLFFKKMTSERMDKPFCTEMSSDQLNTLEESVKEITEHIFSIVCELESYQDIEPYLAASLSAHVEGIICPFQSCLFLVDLYIIPICTEINPGLSLTHFKSWFVTWNILFSQATHRAIKACEAYRT